MKLEELKEKVLSNNLENSLFIFTYLENTFVINQYIGRIAKNNSLQIEYINNIDKLLDLNDNIFNEPNNDILYIYNVDEFVLKDKYINLKNCIVICKKVIKDVDYEYIIEFPKLVDWQIKDYLKVKAPEISDNDIEWLYKITNGNIYRLDNEISKISIFPKEFQLLIFNSIKDDSGYSDLSDATLFTLSNAIIRKNIEEIKNFNLQVDIFGLISILHNNFKNILNIQTQPNIKASDLKITDKQFYAIKKYNCGYYNINQLINIYEFLTSIDKQIKLGNLDISSDELMYYILVNILEA